MAEVFQRASFNVKAFGAKGDGVTRDAAAFNATIAAAIAEGFPNNRTKIVLSPGYYVIESPLIIDSDYITIEGVDMLSTVLMLPAGVADVTAVMRVGVSRMVSQFVLRNIGIEGGADKGHTTGHCLVTNCNGVLLDNVYLSNAPQDGWQATPSSSAFRHKASNVYVNLPGRDGVVIGANCNDTDLYNVEVKGGSSSASKGGRYGIYNKGGETHLYGCHPFFMATDGLRSDLGNVQVLGGEYETNGGDGITLTTQTQVSTVQGVTGFYGNNVDIYVSQNSWPVIVKGNVLRSSTARNMWMDNTNDAIVSDNVFYAATTESIQIAQCTRGNLRGNTFMPATGATRSANLNASTRFNVTDNVLGGSTPKPIAETGASDRNNIYGNQLNGASVTVVGANTIRTGADIA